MKNIEEITIRPVTEADAEKLLAIYAPYVTDTFVTYEYTVPTVEEFRERIRNTLQAYPYFAAVENGRIIGYAYASAFHPRRAYLWSAEATVYLERGVRGRGLVKAEQGGAVAAMFGKYYITSKTQIQYQCATANCAYFRLTDGSRYVAYSNGDYWTAAPVSSDIAARNYFMERTGGDYSFIILDD